MEELYEQRLRLVTEKLSQAQTEIASLRQENSTQKDLLLGGSKTLSEVKTKYDLDRSSWTDERQNLERKLHAVSVANLDIFFFFFKTKLDQEIFQME